jgi:Zn-dependent peptidase ImmA (M78 family)
MALKFLLEFNVNSLPVQLSPITKQLGIIIHTDTIGFLEPQMLGGVVTHKSRIHIVLRDDDYITKRLTIAHELGHLYLNHPNVEGFLKRSWTFKNPFEFQAERFARNILAPRCVLYELGLKSPQQIAEVCEIPLDCAEEVAERLTLYHPNHADMLERLVVRKFRNYINAF